MQQSTGGFDGSQWHILTPQEVEQSILSASGPAVSMGTPWTPKGALARSREALFNRGLQELRAASDRWK